MEAVVFVGFHVEACGFEAKVKVVVGLVVPLTGTDGLT